MQTIDLANRRLYRVEYTCGHKVWTKITLRPGEHHQPSWDMQLKKVCPKCATPT